jgi:hypothetical protein
MKTTRFVVAGALCAWLLLVAQVFAAETYSGSWTLRPSETPGKVNFGLVYRRGHNNMNHESDWPSDEFQGLDLDQRGKRDVQFAVAREAGRFDCEGYLNNGVGAGVFLFTPDEKFSKAMGDLGFGGIDEPMQFAMATIDVTTTFARQMQAQKLVGLTTDKLMALKIFDVTPQYLREMRDEGLPMTEVDKVIAFRVHGIETSRVREFKKLGIQADENQLVAMQVHGATPEWVAEMRKSFQDLDVDQLVAMRVHGVTPEYIAQMKARGLKNLSIDKLIEMRVHGIN